MTIFEKVSILILTGQCFSYKMTKLEKIIEIVVSILILTGQCFSFVCFFAILTTSLSFNPYFNWTMFLIKNGKSRKN